MYKRGDHTCNYLIIPTERLLTVPTKSHDPPGRFGDQAGLRGLGFRAFLGMKASGCKAWVKVNPAADSHVRSRTLSSRTEIPSSELWKPLP